MVAIIIIVALALTGCSKEESATGPEETPPQLPELIQLSVPANAPAAVQAPVTTTNALINSFSFYLNIAKLAQPQKEGNLWVWSGSNQGLTVRVTAEVLPNGDVQWKAILNGSDGQNVYNNWLAVQGTTNADFSRGDWTVFETNTQTVAATFSWQTDSNGNLTATFISGSEKLIVVNNTDNSGTLQSFSDNVLIFEAAWQADGSGWWKQYDLSGNVTDEGTWS